MSSKEQTHGDYQRSRKQRPPKIAPENLDIVAQQQTDPATTIQRARLDPSSLTAGDVRQLQRTLGNQAVGRLLTQTPQQHHAVQEADIQASQRPGVDVQRWPQDITSQSGTFTYVLGTDFKNKHMAANKETAKRKARKKSNEYGGAPVTVIYGGSLEDVTEATEVPPRGNYHWALQVDVDAVTRGKSVTDDKVTGVIVSGYNIGRKRGLITHVSASQ